ncbi:hypothetical protein RYO59_001642 [Thermosynechococcaceae cyanobacterium Okahandja]
MVAAPKLKSPPPRSRQRDGVLSPPLTEIRPLRQPQKPLWQRALVGVQWVSGVAAAGSLAALLPLYGWSAVSEQQWSQAYAQLELLKRQERELLVSHEALRYRVTQQVQQAPQGLVPQRPQHVLFIPNTATPATKPPLPSPPVATPPKRTVSY